MDLGRLGGGDITSEPGLLLSEVDFGVLARLNLLTRGSAELSFLAFWASFSMLSSNFLL